MKYSFQKTQNQRLRVLNAIRLNLSTFVAQTGPGVVCLVYSVILTKGVAALKADFDFEGVNLINEHGYAS